MRTLQDDADGKSLRPVGKGAVPVGTAVTTGCVSSGASLLAWCCRRR